MTEPCTDELLQCVKLICEKRETPPDAWTVLAVIRRLEAAENLIHGSLDTKVMDLRNLRKAWHMACGREIAEKALEGK